MKIVIVGCGRVGATLARQFADQNHEVAIVDKDRAAFRRLGDSFNGRTILGLGFDEDVLRKAGIQEAEAFVAITGGDNSNLMAAQIAQLKYRIPKVIIRVKDPLRADIYRDMGLNTYCNTLISARILEDILMGRPFGPVESYLSHNGASGATDSTPLSDDAGTKTPAMNGSRNERPIDREANG